MCPTYTSILSSSITRKVKRNRDGAVQFAVTTILFKRETVWQKDRLVRKREREKASFRGKTWKVWHSRARHPFGCPERRAGVSRFSVHTEWNAHTIVGQQCAASLVRPVSTGVRPEWNFVRRTRHSGWRRSRSYIRIYRSRIRESAMEGPLDAEDFS